MGKKIFTILLSLFCVFSTFALPENGVIYVKQATDGGDDNSLGDSWWSAKATLSAALDAAKSDDAPKDIWMAAGTYTFVALGINNTHKGVHIYGGFDGFEDGETVATRAKNSTLAWDFAKPTIIDGGGKGQIINFANNITKTIILDGFLFQNGTSLASQGGVFSLRDGITVQNCMFKNNTSASKGGGAVGFYSGLAASAKTVGVIIQDSYFYNNKVTGTSEGGAILANVYPGDSVIVRRCTFEKNESQGHGGAIKGPNNANLKLFLIDNCVFNSNATRGNGVGGGVYASGIVSNCVFTNNTVSAGSNAAAYASNASAGDELINCLFANNGSGVEKSIALISGKALNSIFVNNKLAFEGAAVSYYEGKNSQMFNSVIWGNVDATGLIANLLLKDGTIDYTAVSSPIVEQGTLFIGENNLVIGDNASNVFKFKLPTTFAGTAGDDAGKNLQIKNSNWAVNADSPILKKGNALKFTMSRYAQLPSSNNADLAGNPRISIGGTIDMSAYELNGTASVAQNENNNNVQVFSNGNIITICTTAKTTVKIFNSGNGVLVDSFVVDGDKNFYLPTAIYIVQTTNMQGSAVVKIAL